MTTRAWFRCLRAELWARDDQTAADIDRIATAVVEQTNPLQGVGWIAVGPALAMIEHQEEYARRAHAVAAVRALMNAALRRAAHLDGITD